MTWTPDRDLDPEEDTRFRPPGGWGSSAYSVLTLPMEPEEEDEHIERNKEGLKTNEAAKMPRI